MHRFMLITLYAVCGMLVSAHAPLSFAQAVTPTVPKPNVVALKQARPPLPIHFFADLVGDDEAFAVRALKRIEREWHDSSTAMLIESIQFAAGRQTLLAIFELLEKTVGKPIAGDINGLYQWLWSKERPVHPEFTEFKAKLSEQIDPRFREYFQGNPQSLIRFDEIRWGGVRRDGIPPLKNPKMIAVNEATWLADDHVVFGVALNGDVRAYPKRILAWHEMFKDRIAGMEVAGVYCTLCGALVLYDVTHAGVQHELGTSGFLYRSNKLMYDHATKSMWSTLEGTPVVGALVGKGIALKPLPVVTTTWKEWRTRHPNSRVLSLETGHTRDYGEGVAYRDYFATDQLMFTVPKLDTRLANKSEIFALRNLSAPREPVAITAAFLRTNPVFNTRVGARELVIFTDGSGANRAYESRGVKFLSWDRVNRATDSTGRVWMLDEMALTHAGTESLLRANGHRTFWFGWVAAFPKTKLIK